MSDTINALVAISKLLELLQRRPRQVIVNEEWTGECINCFMVKSDHLGHECLGFGIEDIAISEITGKNSKDPISISPMNQEILSDEGARRQALYADVNQHLKDHLVTLKCCESETDLVKSLKSYNLDELEDFTIRLKIITCRTQKIVKLCSSVSVAEILDQYELNEFLNAARRPINKPGWRDQPSFLGSA